MRGKFGNATVTRESQKIEPIMHDHTAQTTRKINSGVSEFAKGEHINSSTKTMIEKIETLEQLEAIRDEWDDLLRDSNSDNVFLSWEWACTWWKHLSARRKLSVLAVWVDSRLVAIAPLALEKAKTGRLRPFRCMEFIGMGTVSTDYTDLIIRTGEEIASLDALTDYIAHRGIMLELKGVSKGSKNTSELASRLAKDGWSIRTVVTDVCPCARLKGHSWESYISNLGKSHRQNLRRRMRYIERNFTPSFEEAKTESQRQEFMKIFVSLHHKRWNTRQGSSAFNSESVTRFHEEFSRLALQRGWLRLFLLRLDARPVAAIYGFEYRNVFYYYQAGFDPEFGKLSVGLVALGYSLRNAIKEGLQEYDFLRGAEHYKFLWSNASRELMTVHGYPPSLQGAASRGIEGLRGGIKALRDHLDSRSDNHFGRYTR